MTCSPRAQILFHVLLAAGLTSGVMAAVAGPVSASPSLEVSGVVLPDAASVATAPTSTPPSTYGVGSTCQLYAVPDDVSQLDVTLVGGSGSAGSGASSAGGRGGSVSARLEVDPGSLVYVVVGSSATSNNGGGAVRVGGAGGTGSFGTNYGFWDFESRTYAGGGGGATFLTTDDDTCLSAGASMRSAGVLAVAGGGGGGAAEASSSGGAGGDAGQQGGGTRSCILFFPCTTPDNGGLPGTANGAGAGGGAGTPAGAGAAGRALTAPPSLVAGTYRYVVGGTTAAQDVWGGAGGGGWFGGGQGSNVLNTFGGGGGGSNYVRPAAIAAGTTPTLGVETEGAAPSVSIAPVDVRRLTVTRAGTGAGAVVSNLAGIECGATCRATYDLGATVRLTATPTAGSRFVTWSGAPGCLTDPVCDVAMTKVRTAGATFNREFQVTWQVSAIADEGGGTFSVSSGGRPCGTRCLSYDQGAEVTLTALPDSESVFRGWSGGGGVGQCAGTAATCTFTVADRNLEQRATFQRMVLGVASLGTGSGSVTGTVNGVPCATTCAGRLAYGDQVSLRIHAAQGSLASWASYPCELSASTCDFVMDGPRRVVASFTRDHRTIDVHKTDTTPGFIATDVGGLECGLGCYDRQWRFEQGTTVTLSARGQSGTADQDSVFTGWSGEGCSGTGECVVTLDRVRNVTATFRYVDRPVLTVGPLTGSGSGSVTSDMGGIDCPGAVCQAAYYTGTTVTLKADAGAHSVFTGWSGACTGAGQTCEVPLDQARSVKADFALEKHTLALERSGMGAGVLQVNYGRGGDYPEYLTLFCGVSCAGDLSHGAVVTVTAAPALNAVLTWTGICATAQGLTCQVTMDEARTVTATFTRDVRHLTVASAGDGGGTVTGSSQGIAGSLIDCPATTCETDYDNATLITLEATPRTVDSRFDGWTGACAGQSSQCTLTMSQARSTTVTFSTNRLTVQRAGGGSGTVTDFFGKISCGASCSATYPTDTMVRLMAQASSDSTFTGWSGPGTAPCADDLFCTVKVPQTSAVTATFTTTPHVSVVLVGSAAEYGSVLATSLVHGQGIACGSTGTTCDTAWPLNLPITLVAAPDPGASTSFVSWGGACTGAQETCTFTPDDAVEVTATFARVTNQLDVAFAGAGSGRVTGDVGDLDCRPTDAPCGAALGMDESITLNAFADADSSFAGWSGACSGTFETCRVPDLATARTVTATFDRLPHVRLTVANTSAGHGTITADVGGFSCAEGDTCTLDVLVGTSVWFTATSGAHSTLTRWWGAGVDYCATQTGDQSVSRCRVVASADRSLEPVFTLDTRALTVLGWPTTSRSDGSGKVVSDPVGLDCLGCSAEFEYESTIVLTAVPAADSYFAGWGVGTCENVNANVARTCVLTDFAGGNDVRARFLRTPLRLDLSTMGGAGSGTVAAGSAGSCEGTCTLGLPYDTDGQIDLVPQPDTDMKFVGWTTCPGAVHPVLKWCMIPSGQKADLTARAAFAPLLRRLSITKQVAYPATSGEGRVSTPGGDVDCGASCSADVPKGQPVTLLATPAAHHEFAGWVGSSVCSGTARTCIVAMGTDERVIAEFRGRPSDFTQSRRGNGLGYLQVGVGGATCSAADCVSTWSWGTELPIRAAAAAGSHFAGWSGACTGTGNPCTVTVGPDTELVATFVLDDKTLTVQTAGAGRGVVTSDVGGIDCGATCLANLAHGTTVTLTATAADADTAFAGWSGDCGGTEATCQVTMDQVRNATATFEETPLIQEPLVLTSTEGTAGTPLPLTTSGGSGDGEVTYVAADATASGCAVSGTAPYELSAATVGTCLVTATKAVSGRYLAVDSDPTTVTLAAVDQSTLVVTSTGGKVGTPVMLTFSGGSGSGAVSFAVVNGTAQGCTVSPTAPWALNATRAGTCVVTATKAGDGVHALVSSAPTTVTMAATAPGAVRALKVAGPAGAKRRTVTWSAPLTDGGAAVTGYRIEVRKGGKVLSTATVTGTRWTLKVGTRWGGRLSVVVGARNVAGVSPIASAAFVVT